METILRADAEIVLWLNQWVGRFTPGDAAVKLVVSDYFVPVSIALCLLAMWFAGRDPAHRNAHQRAVLRALIGIGFANLAVLAFNHYYFRERPFAEHELAMLFYQPTDSSFPANPAVVAFAAASGIWQANRRLGAVFFGMAGLWGLSRVYAGVFYPSDVIAGALIGVGISMLVALGMRRIEPVPTMVLRVTRVLHLA